MAKKKRYLLVTAALLAVISLSIGSLCGARAWAASEKPQRQAEAGAGGGTTEAPAEAQTAENPEVREKEKPEGELSAPEILSGVRVIAHGMGTVDGLATLNCLEGFQQQYAAGVRVFEADLRLTRDGKVVLRHDWWHYEWQDGINWANIPTREKFLSEKILKKYTPLSFRDLLLLMEQYPDICIITDTKFTDSDVFTIQFDAMLADARELGLTYLFDRIAVQIYNTNMLSALNNIYRFPHYIYTLYQDDFNRTESALRDRAAFCAQWGIEGITMESSLYKSAYGDIAREYGVRIYVHTVNDKEKARALLESGVDAVYTDILTPGDLTG